MTNEQIQAAATAHHDQVLAGLRDWVRQEPAQVEGVVYELRRRYAGGDGADKLIGLLASLGLMAALRSAHEAEENEP